MQGGPSKEENKKMTFKIKNIRVQVFEVII